MANDEHLIRAGSKLFKTARCLKARTHPLYGNGQNAAHRGAPCRNPVITVAGDAPACGTIAEKVPVLREVSFTMHLDEPIPGYAKFGVAKPGLRPLV